MTPADWRALIEAVLDGRLSPEAFVRRFMDAWRIARERREPVPRAVEDLYETVEAFEGAETFLEEGATNADDLLQAARRALSQFSDSAPTAHTFDRTRAREDMRRFQVQVSGCAGFGCVIGIAWIALCVLQIYFVSEWIQQAFDWGAWPSAVIGFVLAFVPIVGNVLAFLGATGEGWPVWLAAIVFFAAPAATMLTGWARWRRLG